MTVADELENRRRCRFKLEGVRVRYGGREYVCDGTTYTKAGVMVRLSGAEGSLVVPPAECELLSAWPVACCRPRTPNEFNRGV